MKTASYYSFKGPGRIGITVGTPRGISGLVFFRALAPHRNMLKGLTPEQYIERFDDILRQLDPRETWDRLHELVAPLEPVLLCYERPPFTRENWCHRRHGRRLVQGHARRGRRGDRPRRRAEILNL